jgi:hypothetical protein
MVSRKMTKVLALFSSSTPMDRRTGTTPLLYSQPVLIVCATISLLAVRDAISECAVKLTIERWFRLVHLLEPFGFHCLTCANFCLILGLVDGT